MIRTLTSLAILACALTPLSAAAETKNLSADRFQALLQISQHFLIGQAYADACQKDASKKAKTLYKSNAALAKEALIAEADIVYPGSKGAENIKIANTLLAKGKENAAKVFKVNDICDQPIAQGFADHFKEFSTSDAAKTQKMLDGVK